ncbi:ubiquinol-cytochrome C reductase hinge protein [Pycnococcus provasolii]
MYVAAHGALRASVCLDEEDPVDTKPELEEQCKPKCAKFLVDYEACVDRIKSDTTGEAHCTGQYFDYWSCVDTCVAPKLFGKLQ